MLNLFMFFEDTETTTTSWYTWAIMGLIVVAMIGWMVYSNRKNKKKAEDMKAKVQVGCVITTIGGIVGEIIQMDETHIWLNTGLGENKQVMQFVRAAVYSVAPAPGSDEAIEASKAAKAADDEIDEIK